MAAERLGAPAEALEVHDGVVTVAGQSISYGELIGNRRFELEVSGTAPRKDPSRYTIVGQSIPRVDIPAKVTGQFRYVHDVRLPSMLHARVVRPAPQSGATLVSVDESSVAGLPVRVIVFGNCVGLLAEREEHAVRAARELRLTWSAPSGLPHPDDVFTAVRHTPSVDSILAETGDPDAGFAGATRTFAATYEFPYQLHGMIGPDCAVADVRADGSTIWSGTQAPFKLQGDLADKLGLTPESVRIIYVEGSGCYGRYMADDAALDAALLSQAVGRPVRVQWMRADEHGWDHFNPAMIYDLRAGLDSSGRVVGWDFEVWTAMHPLGPDLLGDQTGAPWVRGILPFAGDFSPNHYNFDNRRLVVHAQASAAFRHGNNRALGALPGAFAAESFLDTLAAASGQDPIQFRLEYLDEPRGVEVLRLAAETAGWDTRRSPGADAGARGAGVAHGRGVALARYGPNPALSATWVAMVAEVQVDRVTGEVDVSRVVVAHDCGRIINPDGVRNQVEGNVIQSASRTLLEELHFDESGVTSLDWVSYPILTFPRVPDVQIALIDRPELPPYGAGEPASVPVAAAIGNAIYDATGVRLQRVPFTPARVRQALAL
jgi:CO/xanthine dehydrogenase Mo-binding subunit